MLGRGNLKICLVALALASAIGCGGGPLKIGVLLPDSGPASAFGTEARRGVEIAAAGIAEVGGRPIELHYRDTGLDPAKAEEQFLALVEEGAYAVLGPLSERELKAVAPHAGENSVIVVTPGAGGPSAAMDSSWVFSLRPAANLECTKIATFARRLSPPVKYMSVAWGKGIYGQDYKNAFIPKFESQKGEVIKVRNFAVELNEAASAELAADLMADRPAGILIVSPLPQDTIALYSALRTLGYEGRIIASSSASLPQVILADAEKVDGLLFAQPATNWEQSEPSREFAKAYRAAHGGEPTVWAAYAHDAFKVLAAALEQAPNYPNDTISHLRRSSDFPGAGGQFSFDPKGRVVRAFEIFQVEGGSIQRAETP